VEIVKRRTSEPYLRREYDERSSIQFTANMKTPPRIPSASTESQNAVL
jgi:hypothetical protein